MLSQGSQGKVLVLIHGSQGFQLNVFKVSKVTLIVHALPRFSSKGSYKRSQSRLEFGMLFAFGHLFARNFIWPICSETEVEESDARSKKRNMVWAKEM